MTKADRPASLPSGAPAPERLEAWRRLARLRRATAPPEDGALDDGAESFGRQRRAETNRLVRGVLQNLSLLDALLERPAAYDPARTPDALRWVLRLAAYEKIFSSSVPDYALGAQSVSLAREIAGPKAAGFVNAVIRRVLPVLPMAPEAIAALPWTAQLPPEMRWSIPRDILAALEAGYGRETLAELLPRFSSETSQLALRINTLKASPEALLAALEAEGIAAASFPPFPAEVIRWSDSSRFPWETAAWHRGEMTVQDPGAALAARLLAPAPGMRVLDACAAPGGKTGHLWELMQAQGELTALEIDPARREPLKRAMVRLYGPDHVISIPDLSDIDMLPAGSLFDRVLIDAPCLALGLIRRHPEIRWDGRLAHISAMRDKQRSLLAKGASRVVPGGRLLWVTCSPTRQENEEVVDPFLAANPGWKKIDPSEVLDPGLLDRMTGKQQWLRTRPDAGCDGFAMVLLQRP